MVFHQWLIYVSVVLAIIATPGPAAGLCMSHGVAHGRLRTLFTILGLLLSSVTLIGLSAAGLGAVIATSGTLFLVIKYVGAAYLIFLGVSIWRSPPSKTVPAQAKSNDVKVDQIPAYKLIRTGYLVGVSNPKDLLFFGALFPQFMDPTLPATGQILVLSATWLVVAFSIMVCYAALGFKLAVALESIGAHGLFNRITGGALIAAGAVLAWFKRADA
jgi:homoserine/homoserine lactone efflux protein